MKHSSKLLSHIGSSLDGIVKLLSLLMIPQTASATPLLLSNEELIPVVRREALPLPVFQCCLKYMQIDHTRLKGLLMVDWFTLSKQIN